MQQNRSAYLLRESHRPVSGTRIVALRKLGHIFWVLQQAYLSRKIGK